MERKKVTIYAAVLFTVLVIVFLPGYSEMQKLRDENDQLQRRIKLLEKHNDVLKGEMVKMQEDHGYVEKKAREKLGIIEKGEVVYKKSSGK